MKRPYHCVFVGLVTLLTFILIAFLLMFTDIGISPGDHLSNGNVWTARRLRLSAELAYYNYWLNPDQTGNSISPEREEVEVRVADSDELPRQHAGNHTERAQKVAEIVSGSADNRTALNTASPSQDLDEKKVQFSNIRKSSDSLPEVSMHSRRDNDITSDTNTTLTSVTQRNNSYDTAPDTTANAVNSSPTTGEPEWNSEEKVVIEETDEYYDSINDSNEEDQFEVIKNELQEVNTIQKTFLMEFEEKEEEDVLFSSLPQSQTVNDIDHKQTSPHNISPQLMERSTDPHFHMPCPKVYRPVGQILTATWMKPLLHILSSFEGKQVTLVIANSAYRDVLLNWLISALIVSQPPLENIVVVCLDHVLHRLLQSKDIPSIVAPFSTVLNTKYRFRRYFELIMMMRLGFMRLINRLDYDSAMYDIDAIILKNPQSLYDKWSDVDIVGSRGQLPRELWRRWGVTICIGAVFIRSNSNTELYWEAVHSAKLRGGGMANDQIRLNYGLRELQVQWKHTSQQHDTPALGQSSTTDLSVVVVPFSVMCRFGCRADSRDKYYIWHKGGSRDKKSKMKGARQGGTWFLRDRWSELHSNAVVDDKGTKWLQRISTHTHKH